MNLLKPSLNWLAVFVPISVALHYLKPESQALIFVTSSLAIIPMAGWLGTATEHVAARVGEGIGGLLNATFGNAAELIIAIMAMRRGLYGVVKASLTGSIIGNVLLVLGAAMLAGGIRHKVQRFNETAARSQSSMLTLAAIALIVPAAYHYLGGSEGRLAEAGISLDISVVLIITYALSLYFSLHTHKRLFIGECDGPESDVDGPPWSMTKSLSLLGVSTALIAWMSEILVGAVEPAAHAFGITSIFVGVIIVAIVGNAAEHSSAVMAAMRNRMDLCLGIAIGSSIQVALFVAPLLVFISYLVGPTPMDLVFSPAEVMAIGLAVTITGQIAADGESNWLEGVQLLAVYIIFGIVFYYLPEAHR
jgi:Ca2+:H+ antiporter